MKKTTFNLHTHTWRCGHAIGQDHEYIEAAIMAGFNVIGFSEHIQYRADRGKYNRINFEDFKQYFWDFCILKERYKKDIKILCGLEAAFVLETLNDLLELSCFSDYIILGQHQGGLTTKKYCLKCDEDDLIKYAEDIESALETGLYSIVAHPDFFMNARNTWTKQCDITSERICIAAKKCGVPLELNIKGSNEQKLLINETLRVRYPYRRFWEIASQVGNDILYGWDAHCPLDLYRTTISVDKIVDGLNLKIIKDFNEEDIIKTKTHSSINKIIYCYPLFVFKLLFYPLLTNHMAVLLVQILKSHH